MARINPFFPRPSKALASSRRYDKAMNLTACLTALLIGLPATVALAADETPTPPASNIWPDPKLIQELERKKSAFHFHESEVLKYADGTLVTTREQWESKRRPETLELFRRYVYGRSPAPLKVTFEILETDPKALDGQATRKRI